jgi:hypothetical protein
MSGTVKDGRLVLQRPEDSEQTWIPSLFGGISIFGALVWNEQEREQYGIPAEPNAVIGAGLGYRPRGRQIIFEPRYAFLIGTQSFFPMRSPGDQSAEQSPGRIPYTRHLAEAAVWWTASKGWQIGGMVGGLFSAPLLASDRPRGGGPGAALALKPFALRYQPLLHWSAEISAPIVWGEEIYRFQSDFKGAPEVAELDNLRIAVDIRVRFSL